MIGKAPLASASCFAAALVAAAVCCSGCGDKPAPPKPPSAADKLDPAAPPKDKLDAAREAAEKFGAPPNGEPKTNP